MSLQLQVGNTYQESTSTNNRANIAQKVNIMKLKLVKSTLSDWYTIERANHNGREWWERTGPYSISFMKDSRLSPEADIEGSVEEMRSIAKAIILNSSESFKRVAVRVENDSAFFCSPKNSLGETEVTLAEAKELAEQIMNGLK